MVVKFFSNKKGGSSKAINYLLNEREQQGTARVLQGDPQLTRQIINDIKFKQKTTVGCLSFEEKNISEEMKLKLMTDFEKHLLPGMKDRYNILWVEHTDKGRLELNFVIPKIDLKTQKSLNPYYHKADLPRVEKWQDLQNIKYNYSSPKDPTKQRTLQTDNKQIGLSKDYEQLDKLLHNLTQEGKINNREQLIELCEANNITITRKNKDYLSLKLPDSQKAKKFKGSIYSEEFTSTREFEAISQRAEQRVKQYNNRDTQADEQRLTRELESYTREKEQKLREIYRVIEPTTGAKDREPKQEHNSNTQEQVKYDRGNDRAKTGEGKVPSNNTNSNNNIHSNSNDNIRDSVLHSKQSIYERQRSDDILLHERNQERAINDSTRTAINARTGTRESTKYRAYIEARRTRIELLKAITANANSIRKESISSSRELPKQYGSDTQRIQELFNAEQQRARANWARAITTKQKQLTNAGSVRGFAQLREFGGRVKNAIKSTREIIKDKFNEIVNHYRNNFKYKSEPLEKALQDLQSRNKYLGKETTTKDIKGLKQTFNNEMARDTIKHDQEQIKLQEQKQRHRGYEHQR